MQVSVPVGLDGRRHINSLGEIFFFHTQSLHIFPKTSVSKYPVDPHMAVILDPGHQIGGYAHLNAMELWLLQQLIQRVGNQMLTAAGGRAAARYLVGDAAHVQGIKQFF